MDALHAYNEMKDIGQMLLGRLGEIVTDYLVLIVIFTI